MRFVALFITLLTLIFGTLLFGMKIGFIASVVVAFIGEAIAEISADRRRHRE